MYRTKVQKFVETIILIYKYMLTNWATEEKLVKQEFRLKEVAF